MGTVGCDMGDHRFRNALRLRGDQFDVECERGVSYCRGQYGLDHRGLRWSDSSPAGLGPPGAIRADTRHTRRKGSTTFDHDRRRPRAGVMMACTASSGGYRCRSPGAAGGRPGRRGPRPDQRRARPARHGERAAADRPVRASGHDRPGPAVRRRPDPAAAARQLVEGHRVRCRPGREHLGDPRADPPQHDRHRADRHGPPCHARLREHAARAEVSER
jgi:hypothetical protein